MSVPAPSEMICRSPCCSLLPPLVLERNDEIKRSSAAVRAYVPMFYFSKMLAGLENIDTKGGDVTGLLFWEGRWWCGGAVRCLVTSIDDRESSRHMSDGGPLDEKLSEWVF